MEFIDLHNIFKDNLVISYILNYFNNSETPIICYKYNKPIRFTIFILDCRPIRVRNFFLPLSPYVRCKEISLFTDLRMQQ